MKRLLLFILSLFYLTVSAGATVHVHYCMGQVADWGLGEDSSDTCGKCGMQKQQEDKTGGCCRDEHRFLTHDDGKKVSEAALPVLFPEAVTTPSFSDSDFRLTEMRVSSGPLNLAPPRSPATPAYLLHRVFRL